MKNKNSAAVYKGIKRTRASCVVLRVSLVLDCLTVHNSDYFWQMFLIFCTCVLQGGPQDGGKSCLATCQWALCYGEIKRERKCADTTGKCPFPGPGPAISSAKVLIYFSNKIYGSRFIKQHSETDLV